MRPSVGQDSKWKSGSITNRNRGREANTRLAAAKAQLNRFGTPTAAELQSSNDLFFPLLALPSAQARRAKIRNIGYGVRSDFELNFGRHLPTFGRATMTRIRCAIDEAKLKCCFIWTEPDKSGTDGLDALVRNQLRHFR